MMLLELSAKGSLLTQYHVEAAIASVHMRASGQNDTDWELIVSLYDTLMTIQPSAIIALNRAIAIAQLEGPRRGLEEVGLISDRKRLAAYPFYSATLGELELRNGWRDIAHAHFRTARDSARNPMERLFYEERMKASED